MTNSQITEKQMKHHLSSLEVERKSPYRVHELGSDRAYDLRRRLAELHAAGEDVISVTATCNSPIGTSTNILIVTKVITNA